ncbi:hypothetical protein CJ739_1730 [Mariniflexile rhizosphaerae]|uniref:tail fiber protein n=1 Tax=unclassified Mariniflexile TaxID=2643887 RepID=UPI000CBFC362|nr:tail fiber protein [Mariniflexile sp. TRM1-10]AXP80816.1 hypothetical protein CJ739_1730 [Mariniflexile sp. TRM1-10]PLB17656.1 MAG: hypothetical protein TRG1_3506 [Flavobacteriaceae bacterium FS1-H7996/R]
MKKILFITCLCLFVTLCLNAQTTPFDNLNANPLTNKAITWTSSNYGSGFGHRIINSDPGGQTLLNFQGRHDSTTWSDIMTLTSNGNVGIGTSNTNFKAHIVSTISAQALKVENINGGYANVDVSSNRSSGNIGGFRFFTNGDTYATTELNTIVNGDFYIGTGTGSNVPSTRLTVTSSGKVGIGTSNPSANFEVYQYDGLAHTRIYTNQHNGIAKLEIAGGVAGFVNGEYGYSGWSIYHSYNQTNKDLYFRHGQTGEPNVIFTDNGNVGIGTSPDSKLTVKGNIHTNEVKVDLLNAVAPDYVFYKDYDLKSLKAVEDYIANHGHLPNIPSAKDMETEGIMLKEMNLKLLEKIEELTLYAIEQEKETTTLKEELQNQKLINENLENRLQKIESLLNSKK